MAIKRSWQDRLNQKLEPLRKRLIDEQISRNGSATDCIHVVEVKDDFGDAKSTKVKSAEVVSVIFPAMKDIPIRFINKEDDSTYTITSLVSAVGISNQPDEKQEFVVQSSVNNALNVNDLLIRVMLDEKASKPVVLVLQITEQLADFGYSSPILLKYKCSLYTKDLPKQLTDVVVNMAKRRLYLQF